ncbi:hypothetical protein F3K34_25150 [Streptomyces sp. LBUM 1486]|nr:hypothetical protein [Streptomyces sp. LBUM 1485]MBP5915387.1 hypothetical protein [Streptomyces sp. LBUM 1486]QTU55267.1 hypothetical protein F3K21_22515 [Streptomyces sp. LBUM 1480]
MVLVAVACQNPLQRSQVRPPVTRHDGASAIRVVCGCEWDDTWRMVRAPDAEPGAVPITTMRHPAASATAADIPNPDAGSPATWAA